MAQRVVLRNIDVHQCSGGVSEAMQYRVRNQALKQNLALEFAVSFLESYESIGKYCAGFKMTAADKGPANASTSGFIGHRK